MSVDYRRWRNTSSKTLGVFAMISSIVGLISFICIPFGEFDGVDILLFLSLSSVATFLGVIFGVVNLVICTKAAETTKLNHTTGITLSTICSPYLSAHYNRMQD